MNHGQTSAQEPPSTNGGAATSDEVQRGPAHQVFQHLLDTNSVRLNNLVEAKVMSSSALTKDPAKQAIGERFYPLLTASFHQRHKGAQVAIQEDAGVGAVLHTGDQDPVGDKLDTAVIRRTIRFDWSEPRTLLYEAHELAEETRRWITNPRERRDLLGLLFGIVCQAQTTIARENRQSPEDQDESVAPTARIRADVEIIRRQLSAARRQFERDTQRAAQFQYARGIALGSALMLGLCLAVAAVFTWQHIYAINGVGLAAGAVGACVSVLQRMTKGTLDLNTQAGHRMILAFGALRPFVGGIFGLVTFLVVRASLISVFVLPKVPGDALAYVAVFAFVAGFNERFFQDMLANASNTRAETHEAPSSI